jgi:hypothetical protein
MKLNKGEFLTSDGVSRKLVITSGFKQLAVTVEMADFTPTQRAAIAEELFDEAERVFDEIQKFKRVLGRRTRRSA